MKNNKERLYILPDGNAIKLSNVVSIQAFSGKSIFDMVARPNVVIGLINGKYSMVYFNTLDEALEARDVIIKHFNDFAKSNYDDADLNI